MAQVYKPKGKKKKSNAELSKIAEAYLTHGRYDQGKSAMIAAKHKELMAVCQKNQALARKDLIASAKCFQQVETLIETTLVWKK